MKLGIKKNDNVRILTGQHKGEEARVIEVDRKHNTVLLDGKNLKSRHTKARSDAKNPEGGIIKKPAGIHISNVQLLSDGKPTRIGRREENGKTVRYAKKTGKTIS